MQERRAEGAQFLAKDKDKSSPFLCIPLFCLFVCFSSIISTARLDLNSQALISLAKLFGIFIYNAKACVAQRAKNTKKYSIL